MPAKHSVKVWRRLFWLMAVVGVWLLGVHLLGRCDAALYRMAGHVLAGRPETERPQLHRPGHPVETQEILVEKRTLVCPPVGIVDLNEESAESCFAALPLGPQDMAVLLSYLSREGFRTVGVSSPLVWEDEVGEMARHMFCQVLGRFPNPVVGLRGRTAARADFTPIVLRESAIPTDHIQGNPAGLPSANRPLPNGLTDSPDSVGITWAPDWLEDEPQTQKASAVKDISFPLIMRWNGETIPTLPFRLALKHLGLSSKDVTVRLGQDIRFGGRVLPLDEYGRTRLSQAQVFPITLPDLVGGKGDGKADRDGNTCVILAEPMSGAKDPERLRLLAATLSELAGTEKSEYGKLQVPVGGRVLELAGGQQGGWNASLAISLLILALWILPHAPGKLRHLTTLGALFAWLLMVYADWRSDQWWSLCGAGAAWVVLVLALHRLRPEEKGIFRHRRGRR